jgi:short-subunit dehydrogenase
MENLEGGTALIIGARGGIGSSIAEALAQEKMNLVLSSRSTYELGRLAIRIRRPPREVITVPVDATDMAALRDLIETIKRRFGHIDLLVYNAGIEITSRYEMIDPVELEKIVRVNLLGAMLAIRIVLPDMLRNRHGHIVTISSLAGKVGPPYIGLYAATKAGLIRLNQSLRIEYEGTGVGTSVICPGYVSSGMNSRMTADAGVPPPRFLGVSSPENVARNVVKAIRNDIAEVLVNPGPIRLLMALAELFPSLPQYVIRRSGLSEWYEKIAMVRSRQGVS